MTIIEDHTFDTIHFLACDYNLSLEEVSNKVASEVYNICEKLWHY